MANPAMPAGGSILGTQEGDGGKVTWYIGLDDGLPRRLPYAMNQRDRYVRGLGREQRMYWVEDAGVYDISGTIVPVPGATNTIRSIPLPDKYTQLAQLCEMQNEDGSWRFPELREARARLYSGQRSAIPTTFPCACGLAFGNKDIFALHAQGCPKAATGAASPLAAPPPATARDDAPAAPVAKPRKPVTCKACGEKFDTLPEHNRHKRADHPRVRS